MVTSDVERGQPVFRSDSQTRRLRCHLVDWLEAIGARIGPAPSVPDLRGMTLGMVVALGAAAVVVPASWRMLRLAVTLVHELGHAVVGVLVGRRFTGFVVRGDMSGHAVTVGPSRGAGRVVTTWAGYPAPAALGTLMIWAAAQGWAAPLLSAVLAVLLAGVPRIRSFGTAAVVVVVAAVVGALWWSGTEAHQAQLVTALGVVLLLGAWRHLGAVVTASRGDRVSDPAVLARLTGVPRPLWIGSFVLVLALLTGSAGVSLLAR